MKKSNTKKGFTLMEMIVVIAIFSILLLVTYTFLSKSFFFHEKGTKNLDAVQDMVLIIHNMRSDLRSFVEFADNPNSFAAFDPAEKKLEFTVINGVTSTGLLLFSKVTYFLDKKELKKKFRKIEKNLLSQEITMSLSGKNKITDFSVDIVDEDGVTLSNEPKSRNTPKCLQVKIIHASNERLETKVNFFSTYNSREHDILEKYWLSCWKIKPITPVLSGVVNAGESFTVNLTTSPNVSLTSAGLEVGSNMGSSGGIKGTRIFSYNRAVVTYDKKGKPKTSYVTYGKEGSCSDDDMYNNNYNNNNNNNNNGNNNNNNNDDDD